MRARLIGSVDKPAVAITGSWDPWLPRYQSLAEKLAAYAARQHRSSVAVILNPSPASLLHGPREWPTYHSMDIRAEYFKSAGINAVLAVHFRKPDLNLGAKDFFDVLAQYFSLSELWLGKSQSLGSGPPGSALAIGDIAKRKNITITRIPRVNGLKSQPEIRGLLSRGLLSSAVRLAESAPTWRRPKGGRLFLPWPEGEYTAVPGYSLKASFDSKPVVVHLTKAGLNRSVLEWPNPAVRWLEFRSGPSDC